MEILEEIDNYVKGDLNPFMNRFNQIQKELNPIIGLLDIEKLRNDVIEIKDGIYLCLDEEDIIILSSHVSKFSEDFTNGQKEDFNEEIDYTNLDDYIAEEIEKEYGLSVAYSQYDDYEIIKVLGE
jgi:hypothetical protein